MFKLLKLANFVIIILLLSFGTIQSQNEPTLNAIERICPTIDFFQNTSDKDIKNNLPGLIDELTNNSPYYFGSSAITEKIRIGGLHYELGKYRKSYNFSSADDSIWIDIVVYQNESGADKFWKSFEGSQWFTGRRNDYLWIFHTTKSENSNALNSVFRYGTVVFNIGIALPDSIPDDHSLLSTTEMGNILNSINQLHDLTRLLIRELVADEDLVMMPAKDGQLKKIERVTGFIKLWSEVQFNFPFFDRLPGLNWNNVLHRYLPEVEREQTNREYYKLLQKMLVTLNDGHTNIILPANTMDFYSPALRLRKIDSKVVIIDSDSTLRVRGLKPGVEILRIDDVPVQQYLEEKIYPYISASTAHQKDISALGYNLESPFPTLLEGRQNSVISLEAKDTNGVTGNFKISRSNSRYDLPWHVRNRPIVVYKQLEKDISYVALNTFRWSQIVSDFDKILPKIKNSKGLIIDIRENGGGRSSFAFEITGRLINKPLPNGLWRSRKYIPFFRAWGEQEEWYVGNHDPEPIPLVENPFLGPIVILTGPATGSASQAFIIPFKAGGRAILVGEKTAGDTGMPLDVPLPGGAHAYVITTESMYPDGTEYDGIGVIPDVEVINRQQDIAAGRDRVLEKGMQILKSQFKKVSSY